MRLPLISPRPRPVSLKPSTPAALQTAFSDGQWTSAANLARQRYKATGEFYYTAVEVAAKSQSDNLTDRRLGIILANDLVKDGTVVNDIDVLDLIELSCSRVDIEYSETIGLLRARLVKAAPKDMNSSTRCFEACAYHSDWKNAQQISASLNKHFSDNRSFLFRYLATTYLYSRSDDCPEGSRKIFASLARAQADKAFDLRVMTAHQDYHLDKAVLTEPEAMLWLMIRIRHCTQEENLTLFRKPEYGPQALLEAGFTTAFGMAMHYLEKENAWDVLFEVGTSILEKAIKLNQEEALIIESDKRVIDLRKVLKSEAVAGESSIEKDLARAVSSARPQRSLSDHYILSISCDWNLFRMLYAAAKVHPDKKQCLKKVQQQLQKMIKALTRTESMRPIFQRAYDLVTLRILFERESASLSGTEGSTSRVVHLTKHIVKHSKDPQSYVDARDLLKEMNKPEVDVFLASLRAEGIKCIDFFQRLALISLTLRLRYYVTINSRFSCDCGADSLQGSNCVSCLKSIAANALNAYKSGMEDKSLPQNALPYANVDPLSDIAVIGAVCLLRLAGLGRWVSMKDANSPLYTVDMQLFLQAVLWLDSHVISAPPKTDQHRMLLVKLYLLMGCVSRAKQLWDEFDIKNAVLDSLGLLYLDRLSTIAPGLFFQGSSYENPAEPFTAHYTRAFKSTTPKWIMVSLETGNYASALDMVGRSQTQSTSCTLVSSVLEERRGLRMKGGKLDTSMDDHYLVRNFSTELNLRDVTDYGILSSADEFESYARQGGRSSDLPLHTIVSYGPLPTHTRAHLGLLAERFLDLVCYVQPKEYKPSKAGHVIQLDLQYATTTCANIKEGFKDLLGVGDEKLSEEEKSKLDSKQDKALASLTKPEAFYYILVLRLSEVVAHVLEAKATSASPNQLRDRVRYGIEETTRILDLQTENFTAVPEGFKSKIHAFHGFGALHAMGMLRESTVAVKHAASYLATASEKIKSVEKTRPSNEFAWLPPELKKMTGAATKSETTIKTRIKLLKSYLEDVDGWRGRLCDWVFGKYATVRDPYKEFKKEMSEKLKAAVPKANAEAWADQVGGSWRQLMTGWAAIKLD
ncbi:N-acetyltransferase B complex non catalytic subunit-domain-containing protein [Hypoxylon sp. FL1284]|nr:N-acetyltransferase B complex non catalytic subunit-domain-containing protein [Hypoxylon sp. FL1284]